MAWFNIFVVKVLKMLTSNYQEVIRMRWMIIVENVNKSSLVIVIIDIRGQLLRK